MSTNLGLLSVSHDIVKISAGSHFDSFLVDWRARYWLGFVSL